MTKQKGTCEISHHTLGTVEFLLVGKECTLMLEVGDDSHVREWSLGSAHGQGGWGEMRREEGQALVTVWE